MTFSLGISTLALTGQLPEIVEGYLLRRLWCKNMLLTADMGRNRPSCSPLIEFLRAGGRLSRGDRAKAVPYMPIANPG